MFFKVKRRLDKPMLQKILGLKKTVPAEEAITYNNNASMSQNRDESFRKTEVRWLMYEDHTWVHQLMIRTVSEHQGLFGIRSALQIERGVQLATYRVGHHYGWHIDGRITDNTRRALSISVLLTDDFEGGDLEFRNPGAPRLKKAGEIVIFNSDEFHRVAPVTKGVRDSLVVWFGRPASP